MKNCKLIGTGNKQSRQVEDIRIGHPSYNGANGSPVYLTTKSAVIAELRSRGVKRDDARKAANQVLTGSHITVRGGVFGGCVVELSASFR